MRVAVPLLSCAVVAAVSAVALPVRAEGDPLAALRWRNRVVVALAPRRDDPALAEQRRIFAALGDGARARDLVLVEGTDDTAEGAALRRRFGGAGFTAVLVGKDGGAKLTSGAPLDRAALFPTIDAMPMRRDEMARRR